MSKPKAVRTTISITPELYKKAQEVMRARAFPDFSGMLHQLIREEYDRRIDREAWLVNAIAELFHLDAAEVRRRIDVKMGRRGQNDGGKSPPTRVKQR